MDEKLLFKDPCLLVFGFLSFGMGVFSGVLSQRGLSGGDGNPDPAFGVRQL